MADIFREVDEDVRRDALQLLWRRWGKVAVAAAVAAVLAAAGFSGWREWRETRRQDAAAAFLVAADLAADGKFAESAQAFQALAKEAPDGYADLAGLRAAQVFAAAGDRAQALAAFDALAVDPAADDFLKAVARLSGIVLLVDDGDPAEVTTRLAPLLAPGSPLRPQARELEGLLALRTGDRAAALAIFAALAEDVETPEGIRARAQDLAASLGASGIKP